MYTCIKKLIYLETLYERKGHHSKVAEADNLLPTQTGK